MKARLVILLAASVTTLFAAQQATFRSAVDVVVVDVSVRDRSKVVNGLGPADFVVLDNGVRQTVSDVSFGAVPIDVTVALDVSGSIGARELSMLRRAIGQLMKDLSHDDRVRLLLFNERVSRAVDFTANPVELDTALSRASGRGATSVIDALSVALVSADQPDRRQLVMFFTDGADTTSVTSAPVMLDLARHSNAAVSAVMPAPGALVPRGRAEYVKVFEQLAVVSGGVVVKQDPGKDLTATFQRALDEFRMSYVLRYSPSGVKVKGDHVLEVAVGGRPGLTVRARRGYAVN